MSKPEELSLAGSAVTEEYVQDSLGDFRSGLSDFYVEESVVDSGAAGAIGGVDVAGKYGDFFNSNNYTSDYPVSPAYLGINCGLGVLEGCPFGASSLLPPLLSSVGNLSSDDYGAGAGGGGGGAVGDSEVSSGTHDEGTAGLWIMVVLMSFLIVVTIVGNILVCLSVILVRKLRKPQNYLLVSLAISDLFVALLVMPFAIVIEFHNSYWPLNDSLCDLWVSVDLLCCTASILNLCGISVDRYQAITAPFEYSNRSTPRRMLFVIFLVWLLSACVSLPPLLLFGNDHFDPEGIPTCRVSQNFWYQIYATMASFYVPLCVMVVVYVKILRVVADKKKKMTWKKTSSCITTPTPGQQPQQLHGQQQQSSSPCQIINSNSVKSQMSTTVLGRVSGQASTKMTGSNKGTPLISNSMSSSSSLLRKGGAGSPPEDHLSPLNAAGVSSTANNVNGAGTYLIPSVTIHRVKKERLLAGLKEHKASTTLGIIMSAFIICWLPFFVLALVRPLFQWNIPGWVSSLFNWLGYANSALNPVIYAVLNRDFRRPFKEILCFRCATLDSLMRKEFYQQQYGDDMVNLRNKQSIPIDSDCEPPTSL